MDYVTIIFIGIGLAMDCFAVSISQGICVEQLKVKPALKMAVLFGLFQGGMPLIGYLIGSVFAGFIMSFNHWLAFAILLFIGGKMIYESIRDRDKEDEPSCEIDNFRIKRLVILAFATSIDALASGLIFISYPKLLLPAAAIIAFISFAAGMIGVKFGHIIGKRFNINFELIGGIILILIGVKIVLEKLLS